MELQKDRRLRVSAVKNFRGLSRISRAKVADPSVNLLRTQGIGGTHKMLTFILSILNLGEGVLGWEKSQELRSGK